MQWKVSGMSPFHGSPGTVDRGVGARDKLQAECQLRCNKERERLGVDFGNPKAHSRVPRIRWDVLKWYLGCNWVSYNPYISRLVISPLSR